MSEVKAVVIQTARPMGPDDLGRAEYGHYTVTDGVVMLTDADGKALPRGKPLRRGDPPAYWSRKVRDGEDAARVARELLHAKWVATKKGSDFNRPLRYPASGIV